MTILKESIVAKSVLKKIKEYRREVDHAQIVHNGMTYYIRKANTGAVLDNYGSD